MRSASLNRPRSRAASAWVSICRCSLAETFRRSVLVTFAMGGVEEQPASAAVSAAAAALCMQNIRRDVMSVRFYVLGPTLRRGVARRDGFLHRRDRLPD